MKPSLQLGIGQQLTITPQLQQAIRLLQLSALDLQQEIQEALEKNPMLELTEHDNHEDSNSDHAPADQASVSERNEYETQNEQATESASLWESQTNFANKDSNYSKTGKEIERLSTDEKTLQDHLVWQMQLTPFTETDRMIATLIIDSINEDGYLENDLDNLHQTILQQSDCEVEYDEVVAVLHRIQQFDPIGIGARNLSECLTLQLRGSKVSEQIKEKALALVKSHLPLLARRDFPALKRKLNVSIDELKTIIKCIQSLNPKPGKKIGETKSEYIVPDVYVHKVDNKWIVSLNPECKPNININANYASLIKRSDSSRDNQFLKGQLQEARWFLKSIENRNETLLKVAKCIMEEQDNFLILGEVAMKPLVLHQVAEKVGMHESTISRITTQKYIHTPRGTYELKYFFSSHVSTESGGECSATAIRAHIKEFVANEDLKKPLSDLKLSKLLADKGIKVARRTIAKYRESMAIPPSNERKKLL